VGQHDLNRLTYSAYCDPASCRPKSELKGLTARSAIVVGAHDDLGRIFVVHAWAQRCATEELVEEIFRVHERWEPFFGIEGAFMQNLFAESVGLIARERGIALKSRPIMLPRGVDKIARIKAVLQPAFAQGRLFFHPSTQAALYSELSAFPRGRTVDLVDALAEMVKMVPKRRVQRDVREDRNRYRKQLLEEGVPPRLLQKAMAELEAPMRLEPKVPTHAPDGRPLDPFERKIAAMRARRRAGVTPR